MSDLTCCSWEKCQKSLGSWIDHIDFVKGDCVNDFLALLYFTFWAIYKSSLRTHGIVVRCSSETSTCFWDFAWSLIDCDHIACNYFLFLNSFDHLLTQIVHGLHLSSFQGNLSGFCARSRGFLDLNLDYFSLNNFAFFLDSDTNRSPESLGKSLSFAHLKREYLRTGQHCKWNVFSKTFRHGHCDCCFTCTWLSSYQDGSACNFSFLDEFKDDSCCSSSFSLSNHALGSLSGVEWLIDT